MKNFCKYSLSALFLLYLYSGMFFNVGNIKNSMILVVDSLGEKSIKTVVTDFEKEVNENFYRKMDMVDVNGAFKKFCGQKIVNGTILGSNDKLYAQDVIEQELDWDRERKNLDYTLKLMEHAEKNGAITLYVQHPDKYDIDKDELPYGMTVARTERDNYFVDSIKKSGKNVLDLREDKYGAKEFYKTDHHWTVESSFSADQAIMEYLDTLVDLDGVEEKNSIENYDKITYTKSLLGSNGIRTGEFYVGKDDYSILIPKFETDYLFQRYDSNEKLSWEKKGGYQQVFINMDLLNDEDYNNKYAAYVFDGNVENVIINYKAENEKKVLLVSDSFSRPMSTFLSTNFRELRCIDPQEGRYKNSLMNYIDEYKPDIVIIMYNYGFSEKILLEDGMIDEEN